MRHVQIWVQQLLYFCTECDLDLEKPSKRSWNPQFHCEWKAASLFPVRGWPVLGRKRQPHHRQNYIDIRSTPLIVTPICSDIPLLVTCWLCPKRVTISGVHCTKFCHQRSSVEACTVYLSHSLLYFNTSHTRHQLSGVISSSVSTAIMKAFDYSMLDFLVNLLRIKFPLNKFKWVRGHSQELRGEETKLNWCTTLAGHRVNERNF